MRENLEGLLNLAALCAILFGAYWVLDATGLGDLIADALMWFSDNDPGPCGTCEPDTAF